MSRLPVGRRDFLAATGLGAAVMAAGPVAAAPVPGVDWAETGFVERAGGRIHWAAMGRKEAPVLVVMPKLGGWIADWHEAAKRLAPRYRVIAIDPPGHGGSTFAGPPPRIQTLPESAAMVRAALGALGIERYALAGNSLGGGIAAVMAALFPADVEALALLSVALTDRMSPADLAAYDARTADYDARGLPLPRSDAEMARRFGTTAAINREQNASRAAAGLWLRPCERGVFTCGITDYLPRIAARTLLVYGTANAGTYRAYRDKALRLIPHASSVDVEGAGAFLQQQEPDAAAAVLGRFLAGDSPPLIPQH